MRLPTKCRYGARAMVRLALCQQEGPVSVKELASKEDIPLRYLEKLIAALKTSGLVTSTRGPEGGYVLSLPASELTLCRVLAAQAGPISLLQCLDNPQTCSRQKSCVMYEVWKKLNETIRGVLESFTLHDLAERQKQKDVGGA